MLRYKVSAPVYNQIATQEMAAYMALAPSNKDPGRPVRDLEAALARRLGVPASWVLCTNSCTTALALANRLNTRNGTLHAPVLTWPGTYCRTSDRRLCDVDANGFLSTEDGAANKFSTAMPVALWGRPVPRETLDRLNSTAWCVVVDAAHAFGAHAEDLKAGRIHAVCYSFGPLKEIPMIRGGALVAPRADLVRHLAVCGTVGRVSKLGRYSEADNGGMAEPNAVLGYYQLDFELPWFAHRQSILSSYGNMLKGTGLEVLTRPGEASGHMMVVRLPSFKAREGLQMHLRKAGIETSVHYYLPLDCTHDTHPHAADLSNTILSLPCHLYITQNDVADICSIIRRYRLPRASSPSRRRSRSRPSSKAAATSKG